MLLHDQYVLNSILCQTTQLDMYDVIIGKIIFQNVAKLHFKLNKVRATRVKAIKQFMTVNVVPAEFDIASSQFFKEINNIRHKYQLSKIQPTTIFFLRNVIFNTDFFHQ